LTEHLLAGHYPRVNLATRNVLSHPRVPHKVRAALFSLPLAIFLPLFSQAACKRAAVDLPVTIQGTRPYVNAKFNGQDVKLLVDSGASFGMISSAAAEQYQLRMGPAPFGLMMRGIGGTTTPSLAIVKAFTLANVVIPNIEFLVTGNEVGVDGGPGLIGQNLLQKWDVEYDLAKGLLRLMRDDDCRKVLLAYWVTPGQNYTTISIQNPSPRDPLTKGSAYVNGAKIRVTFDTGASLSVLTLKAAERAGIKVDGPGVVDGGLARGVGRNWVKSYIAPVDNFKFEDGEEVKHTRLRIADMDLADSDMLLGADFFLSHRIFVANSQNKLYFTYNGGPVFNLKTAPQPVSEPEPAGGAAVATESKPTEPPGEQATDTQTDAAALVRRGTAFAARRDFDHALADLGRASELDPKNTEFIYLRGRVYLQKGDVESALADFNRALAIKPDFVPALMGRAEIAIRSSKLSDVQADLDAVDKSAAKQADIRLQLAFAYERINRQPAAIAQFDLWIPAHDEDARLVNARDGRCRARAILGQDLGLALKDCNYAVSHSLKGSNSEMFDSRALVRLRLGDFDKAIDDFDAALKANSQNAAALYGRGIAELKKNKTAEGEADMAHAQKMAPQIAERYKAFGIAP
jgi:tetratricopeptide (TPR) repeat protein/predicted aspartyl protease